MGNLKGAIGDYMYENYNSTKQGKFLKQNESPVGQLMPLKDQQIKIAKRDQVLIHKHNKNSKSQIRNMTMNSSMRGYYGKSAGSSFFGDQMRASNKKSDLMEYDMKTNKIVEVRPQAKDPNDDD